MLPAAFFKLKQRNGSLAASCNGSDGGRGGGSDGGSDGGDGGSDVGRGGGRGGRDAEDIQEGMIQ